MILICFQTQQFSRTCIGTKIIRIKIYQIYAWCFISQVNIIDFISVQRSCFRTYAINNSTDIASNLLHDRSHVIIFVFNNYWSCTLVERYY